MEMTMIRICAIALLLGITVAAQAQGPPSSGVKALRDLEYAKVGDVSLKLDLYLPERRPEGPMPLVVWVHGGAWQAGSKDQTPAIPLVRRGFAVASVGYRLSQSARFPAQIEDCKAAIRWLRANAAEHGLDGRRIGAWGSSAGGHLVALLGTSGDVNDLEGQAGNLDQSSRVQAVADWFGPTDFTRMSAFPSRMDHDAPGSPESRLIGGAIQENKDKVARANPITYVTADDPPFLIMHGDQDELVPLNQSELLFDALRKAKVDATFFVVKGAGHGFGPNPAAMGAVADFFERHLKAPPATRREN